MQPSTHHNSFTALRWLFALSVVFTHSFVLSANAEAEPLVNLLGHHLSDWGVLGFFVLSGFLNSASVHRGGEGMGATAFLLRRAFRILPLLWLTMLIAVLVFWCIDGVNKWTVPAGVKFWAGNSLMYQPHFALGDHIFSKNPNSAFCGSIWTLPYETTFYLIIAAFALGRLRSGAWIPHGAFAGLMCGFFLTASASASPWFGGIKAYYFGLFGFAFLCGMTLMNFKALLNSRWVLVVSLGVMALRLLLPLETFPGGEMLQVAGFAVLVLRLGHVELRGVSRWADRWDASYGIYLLSFPIQQALVASDIRNPYALFCFSALLSTAAGLASWRLFEKPMLTIGKRISDGMLRKKDR